MDENTQNTTVGDNQNSNVVQDNNQTQDFDINSFIGVGDEFLQQDKQEEDTQQSEVQIQQAPVQQSQQPQVEQTPVQTQQSTIQTGDIMPPPVVDQQQMGQSVTAPLQTGSSFAPNPDELNEILSNSQPAVDTQLDVSAQPFAMSDQSAPQTLPVEMQVQPEVEAPSAEIEVQPEVQVQPDVETPSVEIEAQPEVLVQPIVMETEPQVEELPTMETPVMEQQSPIDQQSQPAFMPETQGSIPTQENISSPTLDQPFSTVANNLSEPLPTTQPVSNDMELIPPVAAEPNEVVSNFGEEKSGKGGTAVVIVLIVVIVALLVTIGYFALQIFA